MKKTKRLEIRINEKLKEDYKKAIHRSRDSQSMSDDLIAHIESKVERDKKRNQWQQKKGHVNWQN